MITITITITMINMYYSYFYDYSISIIIICVIITNKYYCCYSRWPLQGFGVFGVGDPDFGGSEKFEGGLSLFPRP